MEVRVGMSSVVLRSGYISLKESEGEKVHLGFRSLKCFLPVLIGTSVNGQGMHAEEKTIENFD